jgi:hypothetical protein
VGLKVGESVAGNWKFAPISDVVVEDSRVRRMTVRQMRVASVIVLAESAANFWHVLICFQRSSRDWSRFHWRLRYFRFIFKSLGVTVP